MFESPLGNATSIHVDDPNCTWYSQSSDWHGAAGWVHMDTSRWVSKNFNLQEFTHMIYCGSTTYDPYGAMQATFTVSDMRSRFVIRCSTYQGVLRVRRVMNEDTRLMTLVLVFPKALQFSSGGSQDRITLHSALPSTMTTISHYPRIPISLQLTSQVRVLRSCSSSGTISQMASINS